MQTNKSLDKSIRELESNVFNICCHIDTDIYVKTKIKRLVKNKRMILFLMRENKVSYSKLAKEIYISDTRTWQILNGHKSSELVQLRYFPKMIEALLK